MLRLWTVLKEMSEKALPMVAMPLAGGDSPVAVSLDKAKAAGCWTEETKETARSIGMCLLFTFGLLSLVTGHATATVGAIAAVGDERLAVEKKTNATSSMFWMQRRNASEGIRCVAC